MCGSEWVNLALNVRTEINNKQQQQQKKIYFMGHFKWKLYTVAVVSAHERKKKFSRKKRSKTVTTLNFFYHCESNDSVFARVRAFFSVRRFLSSRKNCYFSRTTRSRAYADWTKFSTLIYQAHVALHAVSKISIIEPVRLFRNGIAYDVLLSAFSCWAHATLIRSSKFLNAIYTLAIIFALANGNASASNEWIF